MGDKTHVGLYSALLAFLEERGRSLSEYGVADRGLALADTLTFIEMLRSNHVPLLGIELWRSTGDRLKIDASEIWYSSHSEANARHQDAKHYFGRVEAGPDDVFTVQFG